MPPNSAHLLSKKQDLAVCKIAESPLNKPAAGESILALERFALTTNNITYAAFGDSMRYWDFFPSDDPEWGHMPVWGIARVESSTVTGVEPGQRYFGYFPIADHLRCRPHRASERGFADSTDYRQPLPSAYNYYSLRSDDGTVNSTRDNYEMLLRPLFLTSFMLADYLRDNNYFGAQQIVISSSSSKTAYGTAFCLSDQSIPLLGLTSPRNSEFVTSTGFYDDVVVYDKLETMSNILPTLYIDFQGDETLRKRIHQHFSPNLTHDCFVGSAGNLEPPRASSSAVKTKFFFAAEHIKKMNEEIGAAFVNQHMTAAEDNFIAKISDPDNPWLRIVENNGLESAVGVIRNLSENAVDAAVGHVVVL